MNKPKVYILTDYYLPGYKAGGVLRSLSSLVKTLNSHFDFFICTRDRDCGDNKPYPNVKVNEWTSGGPGVHTYYINARLLTIPLILNSMRAGAKDIIYLTSFFSPYFTILPLLFIRLGLLKANCVILAPRGELSTGCLAVKKFKKALFLKLAISLGLYKNIVWHASSVIESDQIRASLGLVANSILEAPDIICSSEIIDLPKSQKKSGSLRIIFLSRISPVKNLVFLLRVLKRSKKKIHLDIFGPLEDTKYWNDCENLIDDMPLNVSISYLGSIQSHNVISTFAKYDLFALPTLGESFGNVILESLMAGTPVLLSDKTPWLKSKLGGVQVLDLNEESWIRALDSRVEEGGAVYSEKSVDAIKYAKTYQAESNAIEKNMNLFSIYLKNKI